MVGLFLVVEASKSVKDDLYRGSPLFHAHPSWLVRLGKIC